MIELDDLTEDHSFLKPIFRQRDQLLTYDALTRLRSVVLPTLEDLKIKKNAILGEVGIRLSKLLLNYFTAKGEQAFDLKTGIGSDTRMRLLYSLEVLCEPLKYYVNMSQGLLPFGVRKSDIDQQSIHFGRKYGQEHTLASTLAKLVKVCLERDKQYEVASLIYCQLLLRRSVKTTKRAKWWVRLAIDLKHLRLRKDSLRACQVGVHDEQWVKTGPKN